ncbi:MAG: hypothetical protein Q4P29_03595 [Tissierellia bacterium]|nr:hypothetical protein [Tissierellia bacterium]
MFFKKKFDKMLEAQKIEREKRYEEQGINFDEDIDINDLMEEGDVKAMIISAFIAFSPIFIVLILILVLVWMW